MFGESGNIEVREAHYERFLGALDQPIFHSTDLQPVHVDVYQFTPTKRRPFWTLITGGMSDRPQDFGFNKPYDIGPRAELVMYTKSPSPWMFNVLKGLAEYPHRSGQFIHWGHTLPNGKPMTAKPSALTSYLIRCPEFEAEDFRRFEIEDEAVDLLWVVPITEEERQFAIKVGSVQLGWTLDENNVSHIIDEQRKSVV